MSDNLTLVVLYDDLYTEKYTVTSRKHAADFVRMEGNIFDWYIEEDVKTDE